MIQVPTVIVALGALLFLMALLGGGFTLKEVSLPAISSGLRIILVPISLIMMALGVWLSLGNPIPLGGQSTGLPDSQPAAQGTSATLAGAAPSQPAPVQPTEASAAPSIAYRSSGRLIYEEDFEDGYAVGWDTQWEPEMEIIQLSDGNHVLRAENSEPVLTLAEDISDYVTEARIMESDGPGGAAGIGVRWTYDSPGNTMYFSYIDFAGDWLNLVERDTRGEERPEAQGLSVHSQIPFSQGTWYTLAVEARGPVVRVYLDGQLVGSDQDDTLQSNRTALWACCVDSGPHEFYFDDIRIWSLQ